MNSKSILRKSLNYAGIYLSGVFISTSFVLLVNDIFYNIVFRKLNPLTKAEVWEEIKPRELFGAGAKKTFIKHKIPDDEKDESIRYHEYVFQRKTQGEDNAHNQKLYENIFEKKIKNL